MEYDDRVMDVVFDALEKECNWNVRVRPLCYYIRLDKQNVRTVRGKLMQDCSRSRWQQKTIWKKDKESEREREVGRESRKGKGVNNKQN